jgi:metal-dependent amidase/aminoacylase/carboxypeptidase family protein
VFHGQTAHAAADPWNGRNALDGIILTFNHISALRQHVRPEIRMHGVIKEGGVVPNIIPERAVAHFILRAPRLAQVQALLERFKGCAEGAAAATGTTVEITVTETVADTQPYPTLQALTRANFEALGVPFGAPFDSAGSTDFGDVSYVCPSDCFYIDVGAGDIPWHSRAAAEACASEVGLQAMIDGAKVLAMDAVDILANPDWLERARREMPEAPADAPGA